MAICASGERLLKKRPVYAVGEYTRLLKSSAFGDPVVITSIRGQIAQISFFLVAI